MWLTLKFRISYDITKLLSPIVKSTITFSTSKQQHELMREEVLVCKLLGTHTVKSDVPSGPNLLRPCGSPLPTQLKNKK